MNSATNLLIALLPFNLIVSGLIYGDDCTVPGKNASGICVNVYQCTYAKKLLEVRKNPSVCGYEDLTPLVCCPKEKNSTFYKSGSLGKLMCDNYQNERCRVFGMYNGKKALSKEFPHMAAVGYYSATTNKVSWRCGGTLISHYFVLSAAHCADTPDGPPKWIRLGDLDLEDTEEGENPIDIKIDKIFIYPFYKTNSYYHDIALFKAKEYIVFGLFFKPACLQISKDINTNRLQATGWGKIGESRNSHLMKATLQLIDHTACVKKYSKKKTRKLSVGISEISHICAGDDFGTNTCEGDSGGPLHYYVDATEDFMEHYVVVGITSFGSACMDAYSAGVYTRVSSHVDWIESVVWHEPEV